MVTEGGVDGFGLIEGENRKFSDATINLIVQSIGVRYNESTVIDFDDIGDNREDEEASQLSMVGGQLKIRHSQLK